MRSTKRWTELRATKESACTCATLRCDTLGNSAGRPADDTQAQRPEVPEPRSFSMRGIYTAKRKNGIAVYVSYVPPGERQIRERLHEPSVPT